MKPIYLFALLLCWPLLAAANRPLRNDLWKHGLKGPVKTCRITCYRYLVMDNGTKVLEKGLLEYAGDAYEVDAYYIYDNTGFIREEVSASYEHEGVNERKKYERDKSGRIRNVALYRDPSGNEPDEKHKYNYDRLGRLATIVRYDSDDVLMDTIEKFQYNKAGYMIVNWDEGDVNYTSLINSDGKCMEEIGVFRSGEEYFRNYHQYDNETGKRTRTTFTANKKIIEVRDNPPSGNILDEGKIVSKDKYGNWITMIFQSEDPGGAMVEREIVYYTD
ncbi:MAG: hypothetical protein ACRCSQ_03615 [Bacteroidales bacterium]